MVVSNRLPVVIRKKNARWIFEPGTGGLVSALAPVLKKKKGMWIGWPGSDEQLPYRRILRVAPERLGYQIEPVTLKRTEIINYYHGFSNGTLWPLFHGLLGKTVFNRSNWHTYKAVNAKFAETVASYSAGNDFIWVQDYQLLLVGSELRRLGFKRKIGFFLHIPFPSPDIFIRLPWRLELIQKMLQYDLIGFQTRRDLRNFIQCIKSLVPSAGVGYQRPYSIISYEGRTTVAGAFPIGIDFAKYSDLAKTEEVEEAAWLLHEKFPDHKLILGVDRLDYTKGIPNRFEAFDLCLEKYPQLRQKVSLIQVVIPSRMEVPEYQAMKRELDELVGRINGRFTVLGWVPIHYIFSTLDTTQLVAHYRSCEIALITPLNDGMNLVAKEYCASCTGNNGVLILSEFAGAAAQLNRGAILVNPYDVERTADAIFEAFTMDIEEKQKRMRKLRSEVRHNDVFRWVDNFLAAAESLE
ncbi:MAG: trehalose-6-phosphate synthase [Candidatus Tritonobacter lacicola]|nr:trehalose-6-phosphate synthase [Candidatus Tritonobacter lacicola]